MIRDAIFKTWKYSNIVGCKATVAALRKALPYLSEENKRAIRPLISFTKALNFHFSENIHSYSEWIAYVKSPEFNRLFVHHYNSPQE